MTTILVTGGAGYIGSHVNKMLSQKGYDTVIIDNLRYGHKEFVQWGNFVLGDLANIDQLRLLFQKYKIDGVMHFAGYTYVGESCEEPEKYYFNNTVNTLNLLKVMREFNTKYFIFSSTCATYGIPERIPLVEDHPQNPCNPYGMSKFFIEKILNDFNNAYGIKYAALRYFNAAGADPESQIGEDHDPETHLIPIVLDVALGKRSHINIFGSDYETSDGTCIRDYIHVNDLASAHILALEYLFDVKGKSCAFNLGSESGYSVKEIIETIRKITKKEIKAVLADRRAGDPDKLIGDSTKAKKILGWKCKFDLDSIINTAWKWHQKRK